jgi:LysR family hydrogen peroxide-inducible transcriptional activator
MPRILVPLLKEYPQLELFLREGLTEQLLGELKSGALDAVVASDTFTDPALLTFPLFFEPFLLAVPARHRLAGKDPLLARDLRASEMVLLEDGHCLRDQSLDICPSNHRGNVRQIHATSLETLRHLVAAGAGYTLVPEMAVDDDKRLKALVRYRRFEQKPVGRNIILVCRKRSGRIPEIQELANFIGREIRGQ